MVELISIGANFVKITDDDYGVEVLARCNVESISKDSVVETVKENLIEFLENGDFGCFYALYEFGWYIASVVKL